GVAGTGLLEAERPEWREGGGSREPRIGFDDMFGVGPIHKVVVDGAVRGSEGVLIADLSTEVENGSPRVVEEDAERAALAIVDEVGNALVYGVGGFLPSEGVGVPQGEGFA